MWNNMEGSNGVRFVERKVRVMHCGWCWWNKREGSNGVRFVERRVRTMYCGWCCV